MVFLSQIILNRLIDDSFHTSFRKDPEFLKNVFIFIYLFIWLHQVLVVVCLTLRPYGCSPPVGFLCPLDSPGKNTGADCNSLHRGGSSQPKAQAHVFTSPALMGGFFTTSAIWEALIVACRTISLVPWPGIKTVPPVLGAWSLSLWTTKEFPRKLFNSTISYNHPWKVPSA